MILGIPTDEATFIRRGFRITEPDVVNKLEQAGRSFLEGYSNSLKNEELSSLAASLELVDLEFRGFAYEGAAMGLTLLDALSLRKRKRLLAFLHGEGEKHPYMVHVGVGWAIARIPWLRRNLAAAIEQFDPLLRWLIVDGYGFHQGYFYSSNYLRQPQKIKWSANYARHAFAQGLGRSLWFVESADVEQMAKTVSRFSVELQPDLWSGIGLACAYAGGVDQAAIKSLLCASGPYKAQLAQGAAFAAKARQLAGNLVVHTEMACRILCRLSANEAAFMTDATLEGLPFNKDVPAYEIWRQRIQSELVWGEATV
jgi:hypothetical protein